MRRPLRIGTRGSQLALWQANEVKRLLAAAGSDAELVVLKTTGDRRHDVSLASIGGKGLFIKELEEALAREEIDLAVHSLKDVPSVIPEAFVLAGFLERADPRDAWLHPQGVPIESLAAGTVVGTSSPRRRAQIISRHPAVRVEEIRGNVDTRIEKMRSGIYGGIVLANAGLTRLGRSAEITSLFSLEEMIPAAGQGIVGIETLASNRHAQEAAEAITHRDSATAAIAERGVLQQFGSRLDCTSCIAVHAVVGSDGVELRAFLSDPDGATPLRACRRGADALALAAEVAADLMAQGGARLLEKGSMHASGSEPRVR